MVSLAVKFKKLPEVVAFTLVFSGRKQKFTWVFVSTCNSLRPKKRNIKAITTKGRTIKKKEDSYRHLKKKSSR